VELLAKLAGYTHLPGKNWNDSTKSVKNKSKKNAKVKYLMPFIKDV